jgi:hypothetical protein
LATAQGTMNNKVTLVTYPDDVAHDGIRILGFDLQPHQTQLISDSFNSLDQIPHLVVYLANGQDDSKWIIDKKHKCSIILINAESQDQTMVGYLAAQGNSHYFGTLRSISCANRSVIDDKHQLTTVLEELITNNAKLL